MTLNGVVALILRFFSPNSIALQANYVTVVENRPIMSVKYCLTVPVFYFWPVASPAMGHWGTCPLTSKSESQLSKYCVVCEISWCRMSTTHSSFDQYCIVTKLVVIEQLLHPAPKSTMSAPWHNFNLCPSSQQILATPLLLVITNPPCSAVSAIAELLVNLNST